MTKQLVSVVIPSYNGARYLAEAIECVRAQSYRPVEIIVINDGSTDDTDAVAQQFGDEIVYVRQENRGPAAARNRALRLARGDMVGFLDADDLWSKDKLSLQVAFLEEDPSVDIVLGQSQAMKVHAGEGGTVHFENWYDPFCALLVGAGLFRKSVFGRVGLFDDTLRHGEDTDWFMRAREAGVTIAVMKDVSLFYRWHEDNMSLDTKERQMSFIRALKKSLDRRRRAGGGAITPIPKLADLDKVLGFPPQIQEESVKCEMNSHGVNFGWEKNRHDPE